MIKYATSCFMDLLLSLIVSQLPLFGERVGALDDLAGKADTIIVGQIQSGQQVGNSIAVVLSVVRVIKGTLMEGSLLDVSGEVRHPLSRSNIQSGRGLWFLKQSAGHWTFLPIMANPAFLEHGCFIPYIETSLGPRRDDTLPQTDGDKVALEIVSSLREGRIDRKDPYIINWIIDVMLGQRPFITSLLRGLRAETNPDLHILGLTALLTTEDQISALAELAGNVNLLERIKQMPLAGIAICGITNPDSTVVSSLGRISVYDGLQACAAESLAAIHTVQTLPFLARLLDSKEPTAREWAVRGLSRFVENLPIRQEADHITGKSLIPRGPAPYRSADTDRFSLSRRRLTLTGESDTEYVQFWKLWWARMQNELGRESAAQSVN